MNRPKPRNNGLVAAATLTAAMLFEASAALAYVYLVGPLGDVPAAVITVEDPEPLPDTPRGRVAPPAPRSMQQAPTIPGTQQAPATPQGGVIRRTPSVAPEPVPQQAPGQHLDGQKGTVIAPK